MSSACLMQCSMFTVRVILITLTAIPVEAINSRDRHGAVAYLCNENVTGNLIPAQSKEKCFSNIQKEEVEGSKVQIINKQNLILKTVPSCSLSALIKIFHCSQCLFSSCIWSPKIISVSRIKMTEKECRDAFFQRTLNIDLNRDIKINKIISRKFYGQNSEQIFEILGYKGLQGTCVGETFHYKQMTYDNKVVTVHLKIKVENITAKYNKIGNYFTFENRKVIKNLNKNVIFDDEFGTILMYKFANLTCIDFFKRKILYNHTLYELENKFIIQNKNNSEIVILRKKKKMKLCDTEIYIFPSQIPNIYLCKNCELNLEEMPASPKNIFLSLLMHIKSEIYAKNIFFHERKFFMVNTECLQNYLASLRQPELYVLTILKTLEGVKIYRLGNFFYYKICDKVNVTLSENYLQCHKDLAVTYNHSYYFLDRMSYILKNNSTDSLCTPDAVFIVKDIFDNQFVYNPSKGIKLELNISEFKLQNGPVLSKQIGGSIFTIEDIINYYVGKMQKMTKIYDSYITVNIDDQFKQIQDTERIIAISSYGIRSFLMGLLFEVEEVLKFFSNNMLILFGKCWVLLNGGILTIQIITTNISQIKEVTVRNISTALFKILFYLIFPVFFRKPATNSLHN